MFRRSTYILVKLGFQQRFHVIVIELRTESQGRRVRQFWLWKRIVTETPMCCRTLRKFLLENLGVRFKCLDAILQRLDVGLGAGAFRALRSPSALRSRIMNSIDIGNEQVITNLMTRCFARATLWKLTLASLSKAHKEISITIGLIPLHFVFLAKGSIKEVRVLSLSWDLPHAAKVACLVYIGSTRRSGCGLAC